MEYFCIVLLGIKTKWTNGHFFVSNHTVAADFKIWLEQRRPLDRSSKVAGLHHLKVSVSAAFVSHPILPHFWVDFEALCNEVDAEPQQKEARLFAPCDAQVIWAQLQTQVPEKEPRWGAPPMAIPFFAAWQMRHFLPFAFLRICQTCKLNKIINENFKGTVSTPCGF